MTNKNKEHCEVGCDSKHFPRGRSLHSSSSLSHLTRVIQPSCLVPLSVQVGPGRGQLVSQQCFSLARGVCTLTRLYVCCKEMEDLISSFSSLFDSVRGPFSRRITSGVVDPLESPQKCKFASNFAKAPPTLR